MTHRIPLLAALAGLAAFVACSAPDISGTDTDLATLRNGQLSSNLIECPTNEATSTTALVTSLGGTVTAGGMSILIPAGALLSDAVVTVTVPASRYLEVDVSVAGSEHFIFEQPVTITMSYARCTRSDIGLTPLSAWYIDSNTKALLEEMPSLDNKLLKTVTFSTGHLSGYAIAN